MNFIKVLAKKLIKIFVKFVASHPTLRNLLSKIINRFPKLKLFILQIWMSGNYLVSTNSEKKTEDLSPRILEVLSDLKKITNKVQK